MRTVRTLIAKPTGALALGAAALALGAGPLATPAWAHGADAPDGTDYVTAVTTVTPAVPGLTVRVIEAGARLELTNRTGRTIEVLGYAGEPYLEVRPDGVYENVHSPATYLNRTLTGDTEPPADADPAVPPVWQRVTTEPVARWHDQRTQWREAGPPPAVRADPGRPHRVRDWVVPLRDQLAPVQVEGTLDWLPPPDPLLWWAGILLAALAVAGLGLAPTAGRPPGRPAADRPTTGRPAASPAGRSGGWRAGSAVTVGLAGGAVLAGLAALTFAIGREVDAGASGFEVAGGLLTGQAVPVLAGLGALAAGAYTLVRRSAGGAFGLALSGACVAIFAGVTNAAVLTHAVAPVPWPAGWARLLVGLTIAAGAGVSVAGVLRLRAAARQAGPPAVQEPAR
nr:hypothetical protein [Micromonospora sp. DSM 115978]